MSPVRSLVHTGRQKELHHKMSAKAEAGANGGITARQTGYLPDGRMVKRKDFRRVDTRLCFGREGKDFLFILFLNAPL